MASITATPLAIDGAFALESRVIGDARGHFMRVFCDADLQDVLGGRKVVQSNVSFTATKGSVRGMHYQKAPHAEMKVVRCLSGKVFDVLVDLREGSSTFLKWVGLELHGANAVVVPEGVAHGFQTLTDDVSMLYFHTAAYAPDAEGGVRYDDTKVGIEWPLAVAEVSERDKNHPLLVSDFKGLKL